MQRAVVQQLHKVWQDHAASWWWRSLHKPFDLYRDEDSQLLKILLVKSNPNDIEQAKRDGRAPLQFVEILRKRLLKMGILKYNPETRETMSWDVWEATHRESKHKLPPADLSSTPANAQNGDSSPVPGPGDALVVQARKAFPRGGRRPKTGR